MTPTIADIEDPTALIGTWSFDRTIIDHLGACTYTAAGMAVLEQAGDSIRWDENGTLRRDGGEFPIMRTLYLRRELSGDDRWRVDFDDGRPFHDWEIDAPVVHLCGLDTYSGQVTRADADGWRIEWCVSGPAKDYALTTRYRSLGTRDVASIA